MIRYFSGGREASRIGAASQIMKIEIMKKGKLPSKDRYKQILKKKFEEHKKEALGPRLQGFSLPGSFKEVKQLSKRAEQTLQQIAQKKAKKEAKALRKMVIIEERKFYNGHLTKKGKIYDIAGNLVGEVNAKNGKMATTTGWSLGKYKPKSYMTNLAIQGAINQYSPYFINLRKQQMAGAGQAWDPASGGIGLGSQEVINVYGAPTNTPQNVYGADISAPRQNVAMTSWGVRSDNAWGTFTDNTWGTFADNVWGGNSSDVWGGIGTPSGWGSRGPHVWGTGSGKNFLRGITNFMAAFFGLSTKKNRETLRRLNAATRTGSGSTTPRAPTTARK